MQPTKLCTVGVKYYANFLKITETHPDVYDLKEEALLLNERILFLDNPLTW